MLAKGHLFKAIEWGIYVGLWAVSIFVVKEVWDQWLTKETGIKQSEDNIEEAPTTTICFKNRTESWVALPLNGDLKFSIGIGNGSMTELNEGTNEIDMGKVSLMTLFTWWAGLCYKITIQGYYFRLDQTIGLYFYSIRYLRKSLKTFLNCP